MSRGHDECLTCGVMYDYYSKTNEAECKEGEEPTPYMPRYASIPSDCPSRGWIKHRLNGVPVCCTCANVIHYYIESITEEEE